MGELAIGGGAPVSVQSMTNTDTRDPAATMEQIRSLAAAGCQLVRVAVPDLEAAEALSTICRQAPIPVVADIHFDYRLALEALARGVAKLRINPGNIGERERVRQIVIEAKARQVPIRIGVNAGSLERDLLERDGRPTAQGLVESAQRQLALMEQLAFEDLILSLKSSSVPQMMEAYRLMAEVTDYPLHLGVTEAGTLQAGTVRSSVGIGALLAEGIGDTIRVSLLADPVEEVRVGQEILSALELSQNRPVLIACPTCGRCCIDLAKLAGEVEDRLKSLDLPLKVAVMGCVVNGPGEAREADVGIAGGKGEGLVFRKGKIVAKVPEERLVDALFQEIERLKEREQ